LADIYVPEDPQDKPFAVLSFSRQTLTSPGFTYEQMSRLADEDKVCFIVSVYLAERNWHHGKPMR
jgi:hypothetical protein